MLTLIKKMGPALLTLIALGALILTVAADHKFT